MNEIKVGKLPVTVTYACNLITKLFQGGKKMVAFCFLQKSHWLFCVGVGSLDAVSRFQN